MSDSITDLAIKQVQDNDQYAQAIMQTDAQGRTTLVIPPELSKKFNVLAASTVLTQEQPFFKPTFSIIALDPDTENGGDFYNLQGKLAPTKHALLQLADAAGVVFDRESHGESGPLETIELPTGRSVKVASYSFHAGGYIRMPDGTMKPLPPAVERFQPSLAFADIEINATKYGKKDGWQVKVEKEFLFQARKASNLTRAKAMNSVMRDALPKLKQKYDAAEVNKSFLVVSWSWSPDMEDENTGRIVAALVGADTQALYGPPRDIAPALAMLDADIAGEAEVIESEPDDDSTDAIPDFEVIETAESEPSANKLKGKRLARLVELAGYRLAKSNYANETLLGVWHVDPEWFAELAKWAATCPKMVPSVLADVENSAEFAALVVENGGDVDA
jgi:hypothetical protein